MKPYNPTSRSGMRHAAIVSVAASIACTSLVRTVYAQPQAANDAATAPRINAIEFQRRNVFDLSNPSENNRLYRLANRLHVLTREKTIRDQLLFREGDVLDTRLLTESERILRGNKYLYDASIVPAPNANGDIDIIVKTKDVWSFTPEVSISRKGGENKTIFGVEEANLFGKGILVLLSRSDDVDRTSTFFEYVDRNIGENRVSLALRIADNSDGHSRFINLGRPFFALDTRLAGGVSYYDDERRSAIYSLGSEVAEYRHEKNLHTAHFGWSGGLRGDWVRRWTAGFVYDDNRFSAPADATLPVLLPDKRRLVYPFVSLEVLEDRFEKTTNSDQIERSEDFYLGTRVTASLGYAGHGLGSDRSAVIYSATTSRGFGSLGRHALILNAATGGRLESGRATNSITRLNARLYWRQSEKRLFFASIDGLLGHALDLDSRIEIGGDSGLRGYPLRYQTGDSRLLMSVEQRYFTDWYPFRLFRIGGAVFFDAGRSWGDNPAGGPNLGWLKNAGFGLRFAPTRLSTRKIFHLDFAFPLDGDPTIDDFQIQLEAKRSF